MYYLYYEPISIWKRIAEATTWIFLLMLIPLSALGYFAEKTVPGNALYPMKRNIEKLVLKLESFDKSAQALYQVNLADSRFNEAETLLAANNNSKQLSVLPLEDLTKQIDSAKESINTISDPAEKKQAIETLINNITTYQNKLAQIQTSYALSNVSTVSEQQNLQQTIIQQHNQTNLPFAFTNQNQNSQTSQTNGNAQTNYQRSSTTQINANQNQMNQPSQASGNNTNSQNTPANTQSNTGLSQQSDQQTQQSNQQDQQISHNIDQTQNKLQQDKVTLQQVDQNINNGGSGTIPTSVPVPIPTPTPSPKTTSSSSSGSASSNANNSNSSGQSNSQGNGSQNGNGHGKGQGNGQNNNSNGQGNGNSGNGQGNENGNGNGNGNINGD